MEWARGLTLSSARMIEDSIQRVAMWEALMSAVAAGAVQAGEPELFVGLIPGEPAPTLAQEFGPAMAEEVRQMTLESRRRLQAKRGAGNGH